MMAPTEETVMDTLDRRSFVAVLAATGAGAGGCLGSGGDDGGSSTAGGSGERDLFDRTLAPASDGNPVVESLDPGAGAVLELDATYTEGAVATVVHGDTGVPMATTGLGELYDQRTPVTSDPLPASSAPHALCCAMHRNDRVDLTVTAVDEGSPGSVSGAMADEITALGETIQPGTADRRAAELVGPAWLRLFEAVRTEVADSPEASETLAGAAESVYGALARHEAERWTGDSVATVAESLGTGAAGAVQASTGLPAFLVEGALQDGIEDALLAERVSWRYADPDAGPLDVAGGELRVVATLTADLTVEGVGFVLDAPLELLVGVNGDSVPASATVDDFEVLVDQIDVDGA
jgi:hypothetical protein